MSATIPKISPFSTIQHSLEYLSERVAHREAILREATYHRDWIFTLKKPDEIWYYYPYLSTYKKHVTQGLAAMQAINAQAEKHPASTLRANLVTKMWTVRISHEEASKNDDSELLASNRVSGIPPRFHPRNEKLIADIRWNQAKITEYQRIIEKFPEQASQFQDWFNERLNKLDAYSKEIQAKIITASNETETQETTKKISALSSRIETTKILFNLVTPKTPHPKTDPESCLHLRLNQFNASLLLCMKDIYIDEVATMLSSCEQGILFSSELYQSETGKQHFMTLTQRFYYHLYLILCQENRDDIPKDDPDFVRKAFCKEGGFTCSSDQIKQAEERACIEFTLEVMDKLTQGLLKMMVENDQWDKIFGRIANILDRYNISVEGRKLGTYFKTLYELDINPKIKELEDLSGQREITKIHYLNITLMFVRVLKSWEYI